MHVASTNPKKGSFKFAAYKRDDVKLALEKIFYGKCAYCETKYAHAHPVDVEHYRPKGAVAEDEPHGGYWWIAMDWDNLLPSCIDCNRKRWQVVLETSANLVELARNANPVKVQTGKKDSFPLTAGAPRAVAEANNFFAERALLLNPCVDDPTECLAFNFDAAYPAGLAYPVGDEWRSERGAVSIQVYGLNRVKLVQDRTRLLRRLEFLADLIIELSASIEELEDPEAVAALAAYPAARVLPRLRLLRDRTLVEMKATTADEEPYSGMASAWLGRFIERVAQAGA